MRRVPFAGFALALLMCATVRLAAGVTPTAPSSAPEIPFGVPTLEELGPPARVFAAFAHDTRRNRLLVIGGLPSMTDDATSSVWALELSRPAYWTRIHPAGTLPAPRWGACAVYDSLRDRVLLFGGAMRFFAGNGAATDSALGDAWTLSLGGTPTWTPVSLPSGPSRTDTLQWPGPRVQATLTLDPARGVAWLFGGRSTTWPGAYLADVWKLDLATLQWLPQPAVPAELLGRTGHAAAYVPPLDRIVVHGGADRGGPGGAVRVFRDTWGLDPATATWESWTQDTVGTPVVASEAPTLVWEPLRQELIRVGGYRDLTLGAWALNVFTRGWWLDARIDLPDRPGLAVTWDPFRAAIVGTGGGVYGSAYADAWMLRTPAAPTDPWVTSLLPAPIGLDPDAHLACFDPRWNRLVALGDGYRVWFHDRASGIWTPSSTRGVPPTYTAGAAVALDTLRRRLLVVGGVRQYVSEPAEHQVHALSLDGRPTWSEVATTPVPALSGHSLLWNADRTHLWAFGGPDYHVDPLRAYDFTVGDSITWREVPVSGGPAHNRINASVVRDARRNRALEFGGYDSQLRMSDTLWSITLGDTVRYERAGIAGVTPGPRFGVAMTLDPLLDRVLIHNGVRTSYNAAGSDFLVAEAPLSGTEWRFGDLYGDPAPIGPASFLDVPGDPQSRLEWVNGRLFLVHWELPPPPAAHAESASVSDHVVRLVWSGAATDGWAVRVERRDALGAWQPIGWSTSDRSGRWRYVDGSAPVGPLAYRIVYDRTSGPVATGEVRLGAPRAPEALRIASVRPNPARVPEAMELGLPRAADVRLELLDVSGRRVWSRDAGVLEPGVHLLPIAMSATPRAGLYWLRASAGGESANARVAIVR